MRGEHCVSLASFLSLAAILMLIFAHVGQINTSNVPRNVYMLRLNVSGYGNALHNAIIDDVEGLYTTNASAPLSAERGLRLYYDFGFFSYCGYVADGGGICSNHTFGQEFRPYDRITADMPTNYSIITDAIIHDTTLRDSAYLASSSVASFWMIFLGLLTAVLAFVIGIIRHNWTFFISSLFAIASSILLLVGAAIWTVLIKKSESINNVLIADTATIGRDVLIGMEVSMGKGVYLVWASFAAMVVSIIPYMISCCTYRG